MAKKIPIDQLRPGMYVSDLGSDWMSHPFLVSSFKVHDEVMVRKITDAGIHEVYIDPTRGLDVSDAPTAKEVNDQLEKEMLRIAEASAPVRRVTATEEMSRAKTIHTEANRIVRNVMADVRLGQQVQLEQVEPLVEKMTESILRNNGALLTLSRLKNKDDYTFEHSVSVCALQVSFCRTLGMDASTIRLAGIGGMLHDIGKMKVPDEILNKPGRLTEDEFKVMKCHVVESKNILEQTDGISEISIQVAYQHHERHDGSGYPEGLKGEAISQMGKMAAICDVYDAITSDRCYHKGMAAHEALRKIFEWSKFHFDPVLVQQFMRTIGIYPVGTLVRLESGRIGVVTEQSEKNLMQPTVKVFFSAKHNHYLTPEEVDLSRSFGHGGGDKIVSHETAEKWGIDLGRFL